MQPRVVWLAEGGTRAELCSCCTTAPLALPERLRALSLLLVIPCLNCCSQVIVSSCCSEMFSHRVTITLDSQTKAPLFVFGDSVPKHQRPPCSGGEGTGQVRLGGVLLFGIPVTVISSTTSELLATALMKCCRNRLAKARYL